MAANAAAASAAAEARRFKFKFITVNLLLLNDDCRSALAFLERQLLRPACGSTSAKKICTPIPSCLARENGLLRRTNFKTALRRGCAGWKEKWRN
jgi:hypothetical protein